MTNDEGPMTKEFQNPKHEKPAGFFFRFRASSFIRHSSFVIRHSIAWLIALLISAGVVGAAEPGEEPAKLLSLEFQLPSSALTESDRTLRLRGQDARQQLLVTAKFDDGLLRDFTRQVLYSVSPPNIVKADKAGRLTPLSDGRAIVTAQSPDGLS